MPQNAEEMALMPSMKILIDNKHPIIFHFLARKTRNLKEVRQNWVKKYDELRIQILKFREICFMYEDKSIRIDVEDAAIRSIVESMGSVIRGSRESTNDDLVQLQNMKKMLSGDSGLVMRRSEHQKLMTELL